MFKKLENNRPFLKMAFEGFAGDGKTYTATQIAIGLHKKIGSKKPIAIFDTEKAAKALLSVFQENGIEAIVADDQRSLAALNQAIRWCEEGGADILIIDSITHVWEEFLNAYLNRPDKYNKPMKRTRLEFQDWSVIKPTWKQQFSTPFVNAKVHIIFTGRAGYEYSDEKNEETGKREIFKSGIKMKAETETAFEPDILVLMEKHLDLLGERKQVWREATVIKDRTASIDGKSFKNPSYADFDPAISRLLDGVVSDSANIVIEDRFQDAEAAIVQSKHEKERILAEIDGLFNLMGFSTKVQDKQLKAAILNKVFGHTTIEGVASMGLQKVKDGYATLTAFSKHYLQYIENCAEAQIEPTNEQIKTILEDAINPVAATA